MNCGCCTVKQLKSKCFERIGELFPKNSGEMMDPIDCVFEEQKHNTFCDNC